MPGLSGNMLECRSGTLPVGPRWDGLTRGYTNRANAYCTMHRHITSRFRTLQRGAVLSVLSIYEYICIKLPALAFVSQPGYAHYFRLLWSLTFFGWRSDFFPKHDQEPHPPPQLQESSRVPEPISLFLAVQWPKRQVRVMTSLF